MKKTLEELYTREQFRTAAEIARTYDFAYCPIVFSAKEQLYFEDYKPDFIDIRAYYLLLVWKETMKLMLVPDNYLYAGWLNHMWIYDPDSYFRKLIFTDDSFQDAKKRFWELLEQVADSGKIKVHQEIVKIDNKNVCIGFIPHKQFYDHETSKEYSWKWVEIRDFFFELSVEEVALIHGKEMNQCTTKDFPLFKAAEELKFNDLKYAIKNGANVNAISPNGRTPIQIIFSEGFFRSERKNDKMLKVLTYLVKKGGNINLYGFDVFFPVDIIKKAAFHGPETLKYVLDLGANPCQNISLCNYYDQDWAFTSHAYAFLSEDIGYDRILWEYEEGSSLLEEIEHTNPDTMKYKKLKEKYDSEIKKNDEYEKEQSICLEILKQAGVTDLYITGWNPERIESYNEAYKNRFSNLR